MHKSKKLEGYSSRTQVQKRLGVTPKQLRDWEKKGLVAPSLLHGEGETNKYSYYDEATIRRINIVKTYRELDFSLEKIRTILDNPLKSDFRIMLEQADLLEAKRRQIDGMIAMCNFVSRYGPESLRDMNEPALQIADRNARIEYALKTRINNLSSEEYAEIAEEAGRIVISFEINDRMNLSPQSPQTLETVESLLQLLKRFFSFTPSALITMELYRVLRQIPVFTKALTELASDHLPSYIHDALFVYYLVKFEDEVVVPTAEKLFPLFESYTPETFDAYKFYDQVSEHFFSYCLSAYKIMGVNLPEGLKSYTWPIFFPSVPDDNVWNVKEFDINEVYENFYQLLFYFSCKYLDENRALLEPEYLKLDNFLYKDLLTP